MKIILNGNEHLLDSTNTISELLAALSLPSAGLAVAVNDAIIAHDNHRDHVLNDGDRVEIIRAIGGG